MARSVSTYGTLDKEDIGGQKLVPTGSLPTTLQGAAVRISVFFSLDIDYLHLILFPLY